jgi:hypothetical protein
MPKAVARKVEFTLRKDDLDVDLQLIPFALTHEQCIEHRLPRTPIKETERRRDKFEATFGAGATELDAFEALHPGVLARLLDAEIDNFIDASLKERVSRAYFDQRIRTRKIEEGVKAAHAEEIEDVASRFDDIIADLQEWEEEAAGLWRTLAEGMEAQKPDLSDVEIPRSTAPGRTDRFVLFDSKRDPLTQLDYYRRWKDGDT